jgi:HTH-type transcriptional regulator/antitoxin HigA
MEIDPFKTERDDRQALDEIETLMTADQDTPEGDRLDALVTLVEAREARNNPPA